jgi:hypothetical protein
MRKLLNYFAMILLLGAVASCTKDDDDDDDTTTLVELTGNLETQTLTKDKKYLIKGQVFVRDGKTLTIEAGTVLFGDKRTKGLLVIDRGGRLVAEGTKENPIVFTSNQEAGVRDRGDWGGLVILGRANTNQPNPAIEGVTPEVNFGTFQGSANDTESSGVLKYVRVEFAGIELTPNNETNSITMGGVGNGTVMEYTMVSFGGDDGYEWFGGTINGKYLITHACWDDDFDCDFGWSGNVQFGLVVRYPGFADQSQSNAFECDNGPNDNDVEPYTTGTFSNITVLGPIKTGNAVSNGNYAHAMDLRRRTAVSIFNSVFSGFPVGLRMNQPSVYNQYAVAGRGVLANNLLYAPRTTFAAGTGVNVPEVQDYFLANNTLVAEAGSDAKLNELGINPDWFFGSRLTDQYPANPNFTVTTGTTATGASFANPKFNEAGRTNFFNKNVNHIGAFGATDWTDGWAEFNPVNKAY